MKLPCCIKLAFQIISDISYCPHFMSSGGYLPRYKSALLISILSKLNPLLALEPLQSLTLIYA